MSILSLSAWLSGQVLKPEYVFQPSVAAARLRRALAGDRREPTEYANLDTSWGLPIRVQPAEEMGRMMTTLGVADLVVCESLWRLLDAGECGVDVGANIGCMTSVMAARVSAAGGRVVAYEAHPDVWAELSYNADTWRRVLDGLQLRAEHAVVSNAAGERWLEIPDDFASNRGLARVGDPAGAAAIRVRSVTLDEEFPAPESIGVLKLDVEGHELEVLNGATQLLDEGRLRDVIFEDHHPFPSPVAERLISAGFQIWRLERGLLRPRLSHPDSAGRTTWLPPGYLASRAPARALARLRRLGWRILRCRTNPARSGS